MNPAVLDSALIDRILNGYRTEAHVRMRLPGGGVINLDRKLPFLFVHRQSPGESDGRTGRLILGEACYLIEAGAGDDAVREIVRALADASTAEAGAFLVIEVWAGPPGSTSFIVHAPERVGESTVKTLRDGLRDLGRTPLNTTAHVNFTDTRHPPDLAELLDAHECWESGCLLLGLEVPPLYRGSDGEAYPLLARRMRGLLSPVLRQTAYDFSRVQTSTGVESYHALGPRSFGPEVFNVDKALADIERSYDFLLAMSPLNSGDEWRRFRDSGFTTAPDFHYRLLPVDPDLLKRRLFALELEHIGDPAMAFLLRDKRDELDRQLTMMSERNTASFLFASMRLYGAVDDVLLQVARDLLATVPPPNIPRGRAVVTADEFAAVARSEIEAYRAAFPEIAADVRVRPDVTGLLVTRGNLIVGEALRLRPGRVQALLHHEVGTHVLTYYNGLRQPLVQLSTGLADYDEMQEGLAVFSEYLVGGLDALRLRTLAARVVAAHSVEQRADFIETFRLLTREHGLVAGPAFDIAERVHACGGFTRDLIYLRGVIRLVEYVSEGGELEPLYIGKIAARHIEIMAELRERGFLVPPPLRPRVLDLPGVAARIEAVRRGISLPDLIG